MKEWARIWEKHLNQVNARNWTTGVNEKWRESIQLLGATLIYTYNSLTKMPAGMIHSNVRKSMANPQEPWKALVGNEPDFSYNTNRRFMKMVWTMHVASSSLRLPTCLFLIHKELQNQVAGPLWKFLKGPTEWDRGEMTDLLEKAQRLGCCKNGMFPDEPTSLAIILAHRDEFVHGEQGEADRKWVKVRKKMFDTFHLCRVFQSQLKLADLAVEKLSLIK